MQNMWKKNAFISKDFMWMGVVHAYKSWILLEMVYSKESSVSFSTFYVFQRIYIYIYTYSNALVVLKRCEICSSLSKCVLIFFLCVHETHRKREKCTYCQLCRSKVECHLFLLWFCHFNKPNRDAWSVKWNQTTKRK